MRTFIVVVLLLVVGIGVAGFALGWFHFSTAPGDGTRDLTVTVDTDKIKRDRDAVLALFHSSRDAFQKKTATRLDGMERNLDELKAKAKSANAESRDQVSATVTELSQKTEAARKELNELGASTAEGYEAVKTRLSASMDDLQGGFDKANARFP